MSLVSIGIIDVMCPGADTQTHTHFKIIKVNFKTPTMERERLLRPHPQLRS